MVSLLAVLPTKLDQLITPLTKPLGVVVVQIGGNDYNRGRTSPQEVAGDMVELASVLGGRYKVKHVVLCHVLPRFKSTHQRQRPWHLRSDQQAIQYNDWAKQVNAFVDEEIPNLDHCSSWNHQGTLTFMETRRKLFQPDGVHLNAKGNHKLYKSVRAALLMGLREVEGGR